MSNQGPCGLLTMSGLMDPHPPPRQSGLITGTLFALALIGSSWTTGHWQPDAKWMLELSVQFIRFRMMCFCPYNVPIKFVANPELN
eukprot:368857-Pelagomonas_calceolata.AAC.1